MAHSNQIREFLLTKHGIELCDVYVGPAGVLTGSARQAQEAQEQATQLLRQQETEYRQRELESKRAALEAKITALRADFALQETEALRVIKQEQAQAEKLVQDRLDIAKLRAADVKPNKGAGDTK